MFPNSHLSATPAKSKISVYYQNVGGMRSKIRSFFLTSVSLDYDVIVLTETWLYDGIRNSELTEEYTIYRCDRNSASSNFTRGGGVLIAVRKTLPCSSVHLHDSEHLEQVAVSIKLPHQYVYVCAIYIRPNSDPTIYSTHSSSICQILDMANTDDSVVVVGDYNLPRLTWHFDDEVDCYLPINASSEQEITLTENILASGLKQICDVTNENGRLLDLAFVNTVAYVECIEPPSAILRVDRHHTPFVLRIDVQHNDEPEPPLRRYFRF